MAYSHSITRKIDVGGRSITKTNSYEADGGLVIDATIGGSATDTQVVAEIDVSAVKSFYMVCDQDVTVETNDGDSPDDTIELKADVPYVFTENDYASFLLGTDVTDFYVTNSSGNSASFQVEVVQDATP